jgi:hypothetical protein
MKEWGHSLILLKIVLERPMKARIRLRAFIGTDAADLVIRDYMAEQPGFPTGQAGR